MAFLGSSPLGLSFGLLGTQSNDQRISEHENFDVGSISSASQSFFSFGARIHRMYGDKKTIFTTIEKDPRTFYAFYGDVQGPTQGGNFFINSDKKLNDGKYFEENSSITKIINVLNGQIGTDKTTNDLKGPRLKYSDFAYLRDLGVYPSNRLVIARRFASPIGDDLFQAKQEPVSSLISWHKDATAWPFELSNFGEGWASNSDGDIAKVLDEFGKEYPGQSGVDDSKTTTSDGKAKGLGGWLASAGGLLPTTGFTDYLQYTLFKELGAADEVNLDLLFQGNPNVITESSLRSINKQGSGRDSGLKGKFTIKFDTTYEIKYIQGVDPTLIYYDILSNILSFSTSESIFRFNLNFNNRATEILESIVSGDTGKVVDEGFKLLEKAMESVGKLAENIGEKIRNFGNKLLNNTGGAVKDLADAALNSLVSASLKKFKIELLSKIQALSGAPSGPYHITIGHPLRPLFSSGDMIPSTGSSGTSLKFGNELGYNNLPKTIQFSMTFTSARNLGSQEIYKKLSPRHVRVANLTNITTDPVFTNNAIRASEILRRNQF